jgi:hypothetical protein
MASYPLVDDSSDIFDPACCSTTKARPHPVWNVGVIGESWSVRDEHQENDPEAIHIGFAS